MVMPPLIVTDVEASVDFVIDRVGNHIVLGLPLGLGKPNQFVNALYERVSNDHQLSLRIITALSLEKPKAGKDLEARLVDPLVKRLFGDYEELAYTKAMRKSALPANVQVSEFYFKAGAFKSHAVAQQNYISANYTHICQLLMSLGVNVVAQLVSESEDPDYADKVSLSCNTDVLLDVFKAMDAGSEKPPLILGQVHTDLPFMANKAVVAQTRFDCLIRNPKYDTQLFSTPNQAVSQQDYAIAAQVSALIKDGGTLQVGIGSLGDAIVHMLKLRHRENAAYQSLLCQLQQPGSTEASLREAWGGLEAFDLGLYGSSEMFINGFMHLIESGIVKRQVYDHPVLQTMINLGEIEDKVSLCTLDALVDRGVIQTELRAEDLDFLIYWGILKDGAKLSKVQGAVVIQYGQLSIPNDLRRPESRSLIEKRLLGDHLSRGVFMHGGFFLGPKDFYQKLRTLPNSVRRHICMDSVGEINQLLYDPVLKSLQRQDARFVNTAMMVTLSGAVVSDGLEDGTVISGIGGQYNFVAMAHDLPGARSIICLRSTRSHGGALKSNILPAYAHTSIPRHLRDMVVTEYGIASLRGKTDEEVAIALIEIADTRFQTELLEAVKATGKVSPDYQIPEHRQNNTPEMLIANMSKFDQEDFMPMFPLGTDFTQEEIALMESLKEIKMQLDHPGALMKSLVKSLFVGSEEEKEASRFLERMKLTHPKTPKEILVQHLLLIELEEKGHLKPL